ncbi:hydantoinase/oxoprolinase family protein [Pseudonocardia sp. HH130630-07]|uniref:hydantoinase/oxoprolinase family protein n=1 Tax=Pseudonocardia sp. HH130630-07 TaxID=1690815 RepID=UPI000814D209|nr:hydantoinase/oxoprolinase family protein [Pseudonocardia sp. HH130630-07]ANY06332.1 5-oxoprolinase [Pseudonocardia sp. HH130630-07]
MSSESGGISGWRVGADVGGTFTDVVALGPDGRIVPVKVLSTPPSYGEGVVTATCAAVDLAGADAAGVSGMLHGTTVATNAILEKDGATTALVTTRGFRDVLELGRLRRPTLYDLGWTKPVPLVPRRRRFEVGGRIHADGSVAPDTPDADLARVATRIRESGATAVAVCLVNSYLRPDAERRVAGSLRRLLPGVYVTASVDLGAEPGEFERTSTAVVNSYVGPVVGDYLALLERGLADAGVAAPLLVMQSGGGLLDAARVAHRPVEIIESGPAAGVTAVAALARAMELPGVVAFDMGGTTAKASLIEHGRPFVSADYEVGGGMNVARGLGSGAGYPVRAPSIDIAEIGAGGGSVVTADAAGALHVGPGSAGSRPGPACYGNGGERPTLTDANVVLGYLSPESLAGGRVRIHPDLAVKALDGVAAQLGTATPDTARGAYDVAVSGMTTAVKAVTSERGRDPRATTMVAFGGAGPLYGAALARELGIDTVVVPVHPGLFSALGLLVADIERNASTSFDHGHGDPATLTAELDRLADGVTAELRSAAPDREVTVERILDMRYRGQRFELRVPLPGGRVDDRALAAARERFHAEHLRTYGRRGADALVEIVTLRVRGTVPAGVRLDAALAAPLPAPGPARSRSCHFDGAPVDVEVIDRAALGATPRPGPLVVEDMDATTLVPPGASAWRDGLNNIVVSWSRS